MQSRYILWGAIGAAALIGTAIYATTARAADKNGPANVFADAPMAPAKSWTGCQLTLTGGAAAMDTKAGLETIPPAPVTILQLDGLGASGFLYGVGAGCDVQPKGSSIVLGIFADYTKYNSVDWNLDVLPPGGINFTTSLNDQWTVGARVGVLPTTSTLIYFLAGYTQARMDAFSGSIAGAPLGSLSMPTFTGMALGGGIQTSLGGGWFAGAEYRMNHYTAQSVAIGTSGLALNVEPVSHEARASLAYKFNFLGN